MLANTPRSNLAIAAFVRIEGGLEVQARTQADDLDRGLRTALPGSTVTVYVGEEPPIGAMFACDYDVLCIATTKPSDVCSFFALKARLIWDMTAVSLAQVVEQLSEPRTRTDLLRAVASTQAFIGVSAAVRLAIEDAFKIGITSQSVAVAVKVASYPVLVTLGEGLGNMIYGTPLLRWLANRVGAPVDLVIVDRFDDAVHLFAGAPDLNVVHPGFETLVGRRYEISLSAPTAGALNAWHQAAEQVLANRLVSYNEEGRFIREVDLNFLHLPRVALPAPSQLSDFPEPFIRDVEYLFPRGRVIGVAYGVKGGSWSKREWPHMPALVRRLADEGFEVRSFGLPGEHVEGSQDLTGIPMREVISEIAKCSYFIAHDGGLCHIAEAIGVPTLWLFGPTSMLKNGPVYAHSDLITLRLACSPCLYKADWRRCEVHECMQELTVDAVYDRFSSLRHRLEAEGYDRKPRPIDIAMLEHELAAPERGGSHHLQGTYTAERITFFGASSVACIAVAANLLALGDIRGCYEIASAARHKHPSEEALHMLATVAEQAWLGHNAGNLATLNAENTVHALRGLIAARLPSKEFALVVAIVACHMLSGPDGYAASYRFALAVERSIGADVGVHSSMTKLAEIAACFAPQELRSEIGDNRSWLPLVKREPGAAWMQTVKAKGFGAVSSGATVAGTSAWAALDDLALHTCSPSISLVLAGRNLTASHFATVLLLVPHLKVKDPSVGSASGLIQFHAHRLAALGLRPVIVTVGLDDVRDGALFRDNVLVVQAHARWPATAWHELHSRVRPWLMLSYASVDRILEIPESLGKPLRISLDGLADVDGATQALGQSWEARRSSWFGGDLLPDLEADILSFALLDCPTEEPRPTGNDVAVLVATAEALRIATHVARLLPGYRFLAFTPLVHRGIEKNLATYPVQEFVSAAAGCSALLQLSSAPSNLSADAIQWLEAGKPLLSSPTTFDCTPPLNYVAVRAPEKATSWAFALRDLLTRQPGREVAQENRNDGWRETQ